MGGKERGQGAQTDLSPDSSDWAANRFTACPFNSLSAYNGGWHGAAGGRLFSLCPGKVRARISAGKRQGGAGWPSGLPAPLPPSLPQQDRLQDLRGGNYGASCQTDRALGGRDPVQVAPRVQDQVPPGANMPPTWLCCPGRG